MAAQLRERDFFTNLINLYKNHPCLWDFSSDSYKCLTQKRDAWEKLIQIYKDYDPDANEATVKKKLNNLKTAFYREAKKVKESKNRSGSAATDVYKPNLWYFNLMTFLDKRKEGNRTCDDLVTSEDEEEPQILKRKKQRNLELIKEKSIDTTQHSLLKTDTKAESNPFGLYVGKKIEEIPPGQQRDLAEKLISDIIFLAKTKSLTLGTRIDIPTRPRHCSSHNSPYLQSPPSTSSGISSNSLSHTYVSIQSPPVFSHSQYDPLSLSTRQLDSPISYSPEHVKSSPLSEPDEGPSGEILKDMLRSEKD